MSRDYKAMVAARAVYRSVRERTGCYDARNWLAERCGCCPSYISRMIGGEDRRGEKWLMLCIALDEREVRLIEDLGAAREVAVV